MIALATESNPLADLRRSLMSKGYRYVPVQGKRPAGTGWQNFRQDPGQVEGIIRKYPDHSNTGLLTGDVVAIDIDAADAVTAEKLISRLMDIPGATQAPCRTGRAPKCLFAFRATEPREKMSTPVYIVNGHKCQVEVLGKGQQFVAFGVHPETGNPYTWTGGEPSTMPLADLPEISPEQVDAFLSDATSILAADGTPERQPTQRRHTASGGSFWQQVNAAALAAPERWVANLFLCSSGSRDRRVACHEQRAWAPSPRRHFHPS